MVLPLLGCSGNRADKWRDGLPPAVPAAGNVTYKGKPLEGATVVFLAPVPGKNRSLAAVAHTDAAGRFRLRTFRDGDGAIAGHHQVTIRKSLIVSPDGKPLVVNEQGDVLDLPVEKHLIPEKYAALETSGLTADVSPRGRNEFSFVLD
jgi:hypothetical protein